MYIDNNFQSKSGIKIKSKDENKTVDNDKPENTNERYQNSKIDVNTAENATNQLKAQYTLEMAPAMELSEEIIENVDILSKLNANELTSVALSASSKAMSIIGALKTSIYGYISEIVNIMNNPYLSDSEIQSKIKLISDKIKASADEATTKISQLFLISETIVSLSSTFAALKGSGSEEFNDFASTLKQMLSCMNTKPSDFSEAKNKSDINETLEKNKNNLFGSNMTNKFKEKAQKAEINIKTCEEKLKQDNLTDEEKKRIKSELVLFKAEKNLYESISN